MREDDIPAVHDVYAAAFTDLDRRFGERFTHPYPTLEQSRPRWRRTLQTDPGGAWVAERDGSVAGVATGILRDGVWGLSMFAVHPAAQSGGLGRELLRRAAAYGQGARGRIILASRDPRAIASYARLGLRLLPSVQATGVPRGVAVPRGVRRGGADDIPMTEAIDRAVRRAAHGADIAVMLEGGAELLTAGESGYVVVSHGRVRLLAARDDEAAATVLRGALALAAAARETALVEWITGDQDWAVPVCLEAGLEVQTACGPVFTGGDVGPFRPYLPSGAWL